ncbi:MAG: tRNA 2-thiouridine(34) synthase MnmA [Planctomycetia bacterium]|nr:tRNA 2-thiouridine(34) synthase MnmA [Planctomycetia bacterium]
MSRIFIALSGGVDSTISASILLRNHHEAVGIFLRHSYQPVLSYEESFSFLNSCKEKIDIHFVRLLPNGSFLDLSVRDGESFFREFSFSLPRDARDALEIAVHLNIPFYLYDAGDSFQSIVDRFITEYYEGKTPNPCTWCNRTLKFGKLFDLSRFLGADLFATGHYAKCSIQSDWLANQMDGSVPDWLASLPEDYPLIEMGDSAKDQSYVLFGLRKEILSRLCFPLGSLAKDDVRAQAESLHFFNANKRDSQEICFVEDGKHTDFLQRHGNHSSTQGNFVSLDGKIMGEHRGYERYTIGQRKGLGIGFGERIFVQKIDPVKKEVVLGPYSELARKEILAKDSNWHLEIPRNQEFRCEIKIRYRNRSTPATVRVNDSGEIFAVPDTPCFGVASGQALVCYWGSRLLGGGWIL